MNEVSLHNEGFHSSYHYVNIVKVDLRKDEIGRVCNLHEEGKKFMSNSN